MDSILEKNQEAGRRLQGTDTGVFLKEWRAEMKETPFPAFGRRHVYNIH